MIHRQTHRTIGFTLVELLVVIGIMALLMAIIVPATQSLLKGNRVSTCAFKLQQIGNALKAYHLDYGSVPPRYPDFIAGKLVGPGLVALWETGYLTSRKALHCPSDKVCADPNDTDYYLSYMDQDLQAARGEAANPYYNWNDYKYLCTRGIIDPDDPNYKRQLGRPWNDPGDFPDQGVIPTFDTSWYPDDTTVVAWCNFHAGEYSRDGEGQYQVLFWDGSTKTLPWWLFDGSQPEDPVPGLAPDAAWKVTPDILE